MKDFKDRSRTNVVPRVAKRIKDKEKRVNDRNSNASSAHREPAAEKIKRKRKSTSSVHSQKVISYAEIKQWNENYNLDGKSVYQLDAEFTSLVKIQTMRLEEQIHEKQKTVYTSERLAEQAKQETYRLQVMLADVKAENKVSLKVLLKFSDIKQDRFDDIMERILFAFNIDPKDPNSRIDFDMYARIKCFMKYNTIPKDELTRIWIRILNPSSLLTIPKEELQDLLERFSRGRIQSQKILVSATFSEQMIKILEMEGCTDPENADEFLVSAILAKLDNGVFDIELFNQMIKNECSYRVWSANHEFE